MSKKKKNKFKKSKHGQISSHHNAPAVVKTSVTDEPISDVASEESDSVEEAEETVESPEEDHRYDYVKKDVKKLIISVIGLFAIMIVVYFLNQKFLFLQSLGDWIYKIANFQI